MKRILLTGGGTAGHVTPNIALLPYLKKEGYDIHYIGTYNGIEKKLISDYDIPYYSIQAGKLRRYFDIKNITDPLKVIKGTAQAVSIIKKIKPDVIFSKGGFVTVPVIIAGWLNKVPSVIHESDMTPGLANKISVNFASKVCTTFPETLKYLPEKKAVLTGTPIRKEIFKGSRYKGYQITKFQENRPVIMMMGGSLGSVKINGILREALPELTQKYQIVHICGKSNVDNSYIGYKGYVQFEYVKEELSHLLALTDVIISRAGANSISEILALQKPNLLIPLSAKASRGDQILNALSFEKQGFSKILEEEKMNKDTLVKEVQQVFENKINYISTMKKSKSQNSGEKIIDILREII